MKKRISILLIILLIIPMFLYQVKANGNPEVIEVGTAEQFENALATIHGGSNGNFIINLTSDITITDETVIPDLGVTKKNVIDNNNTVTIQGNGHKIIYQTFEKGRFYVSSGTLNLGLEDGSDNLYINGHGKEPGENVSDAGTSESVIYINNGTVNMYNGVTVTNEHVTSGAVAGGAVHIQTNGTFNMYGGALTRCSAPSSSLGGGAIAMDYPNGTFNMYGGEITDNDCTAWGGAISMYAQPTATVNIYGGTISNNTAVFGGAISAILGTVSIENATLENNKAVPDGAGNYGYGGVIMAYYSSDITLNSNTIKNNSSAVLGGAVAAIADEGMIPVVTMSNNTFQGNSSTYGGGIYTAGNITSDADIVTLNTADIGGGIYADDGNANFTNTKVYNNKANTEGSDFYIENDMTTISIMDAESMNESATIDNKNIEINVWMTDGADDRYKISNFTDEISASDIEVGTGYSLIAAKNYHEVNYDEDADSSTSDIIKRIRRNGKIKVDANGGTSTIDELELSDDVEIENPVRSGYNFDGWTAQDLEGYDLCLVANWSKKVEYNVTFKIENGKWSDGTSEDKTITVTENEDKKVILKSSDFPTGMIANDNYANGSWNEELTEDVELDADATYTYTFKESETSANPTSSDSNSNVDKTDDAENTVTEDPKEDSSKTAKSNGILSSINPQTKDSIMVCCTICAIAVVFLVVTKNKRKAQYKK